MLRFILLFSLLISCCSNAQEEKNRFPFNEFGASANLTLNVSPDYDVKDGFGGGLSIYKSWRADKKINPVAGIDYNFTNFSAENVFDHIGYNYRDLHFRYHQVRLPFSARFQIGKTTTFFFEPGIYADLMLGGSYRGTEENTSTYETRKINKKLLPTADLGVFLGMGVQIPITRGKMIFKIEVNKGLGRTTLASGNPRESIFFYNSFARFSVIFQRT